MNGFYQRVGTITEGTRQALLLLLNRGRPEWAECHDAERRYKCWTVNAGLMFVILPPGGCVNRHSDPVYKSLRLNTVLVTNPNCVNCMVIDGITHTTHLEELGIYQFDASLEHWSENNGATERIVMVETIL